MASSFLHKGRDGQRRALSPAEELGPGRPGRSPGAPSGLAPERPGLEVCCDDPGSSRGRGGRSSAQSLAETRPRLDGLRAGFRPAPAPARGPRRVPAPPWAHKWRLCAWLHGIVCVSVSSPGLGANHRSPPARVPFSALVAELRHGPVWILVPSSAKGPRGASPGPRRPGAPGANGRPSRRSPWGREDGAEAVPVSHARPRRRSRPNRPFHLRSVLPRLVRPPSVGTC